jgi:molybdopterin molybdotransferase
MSKIDIHVTPHEARYKMLGSAKQLMPVQVGLREALGLVLAQEIVPLINHPPFDNSAMDGYAVIAKDLAGASKESPKELRVIETIPAGSMPRLEVTSGCASKIMTGAPVPKGADAVVRFEETKPGEDSVTVFTSVKAGRDIRRLGEDLTLGKAVLSEGQMLSPARIGLVAASGIPTLQVYPRPKVGIVVTGEEIVDPGQPLPDGSIYNSNGYTLYNQIIEAGGLPIEYGVARDNLESLKKTVRQALDECDIVVSSGGVSMGDYDFVEEAVAASGAKILFTRVSQRPGKPLVGATTDASLFFGLPGNPVSVMVCFEIYVRPVIRKILGRRQIYRPTCKGTFIEPFKKRAGKLYWSRVIIEPGKDGCRLRPSASQGSGVLRSMAFGDGLAELPEELAVVTPDTVVTVHMFEDWK